MGWCRARVLVVEMRAMDGPIHVRACPRVASGLVVAPVAGCGGPQSVCVVYNRLLVRYGFPPVPSTPRLLVATAKSFVGGVPSWVIFFCVRAPRYWIVSPLWMSSGWLVAGALRLAKRSARGILAVSLSRNKLRLPGPDVLSSNTPMWPRSTAAPRFMSSVGYLYTSLHFIHCLMACEWPEPALGFASRFSDHEGVRHDTRLKK